MFRFPRGICDKRTGDIEQHTLTPCEIPHKDILKALRYLKRRDRKMSNFRNYPPDTARGLDGLVLSVHGFDE